MNISDIAIRRPVFTTMVTMGLAVLGLIAYQRLETDMYPDVTLPLISVSVLYPGASPEDIEREVVKPIEESVVSINHIDYVSSVSRDSLAQVFLVFKLEADFDKAANDVRDKISAIRNKLPDAAEEPVVQKFDLGAAPVLVYTAHADLPSDKVRDIVEDRIKPELERVPGVARVDINGGREREIRVELDPVKLAALRITPANVVQQLKLENASVPAGHYTSDGKEIAVRTLGQFVSTDDVANTVLLTAPDGGLTRLRDVATVRDGFKELRSIVRANGEDAVAFEVVKASKANTVSVSHAVQAALAKLQPSLPKELSTDLLINQAVYIEANADEVEIAIVFGGLMAILVILFFMRDLRSTFISALALPTAVIGTFLLMWWLGFSLNMVTLLALSLAIGLLIDDAVVVRENIFRHLEHGEDPMTAASRGTQEIALAVLATTLTIVAVFVPVAFMSGMVGQFFKQFGLTISGAVLLSMFVAFTLDPMLSARLATRISANDQGVQRGPAAWVKRVLGRFFDGVDASYRYVLVRCLRHPWVVLLIAIGTFVGSVKLGSAVGGDFVAPEDRGQFIMHLEYPSDTSLEETSLRSRHVEKALIADPRFKIVFATVGPNGDVYKSKFRIDVGDKTKRRENVWQLQDVARDIALNHSHAAKVVVSQAPPLEGAPDQDNPIMLVLQGPSYDVLVPTAEKIAAAMKKVTGAIDVSVKHTQPKREMHVEVDRALAAQQRLPLGIIGSALRTALDGEVAGTLRGHNYRGEEDETDIRVLLADRDRRDVQALAMLPLAQREDSIVRLGDVSRVAEAMGESQINRLDRVRQITITAAAQGRPMGRVVDDVDKLLPQLVPAGYEAKWMGMVRDMQDSNRAFGLAFAVAALFIYIVLASQFESFIHPVTIMLSLPLATIGAFFALYLHGSAISLGSQIGMILLMGLVTKNAILLVDAAIQQQREGLQPRDAMLEAGPRRLRPILMTTAAMVLGMLPTALGKGIGSEFRAPMAVSVIGGVISSTFLTLIVVPVVYLGIERFRRAARRVVVRIFKIEQKPDPLLARPEGESDRAAAE
jgi:hydrophobic/amphiphilic exporter-1 (mainly G- bacteria), HAE1 family